MLFGAWQFFVHVARGKSRGKDCYPAAIKQEARIPELYLISFLQITPASPKTLEPSISRVLGSGIDGGSRTNVGWIDWVVPWLPYKVSIVRS